MQVDLAGLSWPAITRIHDHFADIAVRLSNTGKEVKHQLYLVDADDEGVVLKQAAVPAKLMHKFFSDARGKDAFASFLHALLSEGHPVREQFTQGAGFSARVLVFYCEVWAVVAKSEEDMSKFVEGKVAVSASPKRKEAVQVMVHMPGLTAMSLNFIESKPKRRCTRGTFPTFEEAMRLTGRFAQQERAAE